MNVSIHSKTWMSSAALDTGRSSARIFMPSIIFRSMAKWIGSKMLARSGAQEAQAAAPAAAHDEARRAPRRPARRRRPRCRPAGRSGGARPSRVEHQRVSGIVTGQRRLAEAAGPVRRIHPELVPLAASAGAQESDSRGSSSCSRRGSRGSRSCRSRRGPGRSAPPRATRGWRARESGSLASPAAFPCQSRLSPGSGAVFTAGSAPQLRYQGRATRKKASEQPRKAGAPARRPGRRDLARYFSGVMASCMSRIPSAIF